MIRTFIILLFAALTAQSQSLYPQQHWQPADPAALGWSVERLGAAHAYAKEIGPSAVMIVHRGALVVSWGDVDRRHAVQSVRKSFLSALYGVHQIDVEASLAGLGIDDRPPLTDAEKSARVKHLLTSSSGIYHSALYEHPSWKKRKPARGAHAPGQEWFYNNWDFNALGTIFERSTKTSIGDAFARDIAGPIGMEDFRPRDVAYLTRRSLPERIMKNDSDHRAYIFSVTARDMARFGLLYLNEGRWDGKQVVPAEWVRESTRAHLDAGRRGSFGYMWWVAPDMVYASGAGGHRILILPKHDLVVVHQVPTGGVGLFTQLRRRFFGGPSVEDEEVAKLLELILAAHPAAR